MSNNSLRTTIANAALKGIEAYYSQPIMGPIREEQDVVADAVLAALADPPEEVIERATEALRQDSYAVACPPWDSLTEEQKAGWLARGRLTVRAAFGGEQGD